MLFLLDEDVHPAVAEIGRNLGLDVVSVHEIGRRGLSDRAQLALAAADGRTVVTRNRDDFVRLTVEGFQTGAVHAGVLIIPRSLPNDRPARIADALRRWSVAHAGLDVESRRYLLDFLAAE